MNGEPEPVGGPDKLGAAVQGLWFIWLGLLLGAVTILGVISAVVVSQGPLVDGDEARLLVVVGLLVVFANLVAAFVVIPMMMPVGSGPSAGGANEPFPGFGAYSSQFFIRAGLLEGAAIICAVFLVVTANWVLLAAAVVPLAALTTLAPTRARVEAFAEAVRRKVENF